MDWPSAQKQITGWTKPVHKCFSTRAEAQRFLDGDHNKANIPGDESLLNGPESGGLNEHTDVDAKKPKKAISSHSKPKDQLSTDDHTYGYEPGLGLPPGAEDGFDPNILLDPGTGNVIIKTKGQKAATKVQAVTAAPGSMLRVYTDGSSLRNGQEGAFAGVGVYFGPCDIRSDRVPLFHSRDQSLYKVETSPNLYLVTAKLISEPSSRRSFEHWILLPEIGS